MLTELKEEPKLIVRLEGRPRIWFSLALSVKIPVMTVEKWATLLATTSNMQ